MNQMMPTNQIYNHTPADLNVFVFDGDIDDDLDDFEVNDDYVDIEDYLRDFKCDGEHRFYFKNGNIFMDVFWSKGTYHGKYSMYYINGKLMNTCNFKNGKLHGKNTYYWGKLKLIKEYKDDNLISSKEYKDDNLISSKEYKSENLIL